MLGSVKLGSVKLSQIQLGQVLGVLAGVGRCVADVAGVQHVLEEVAIDLGQVKLRVYVIFFGKDFQKKERKKEKQRERKEDK